MEAIRRLEGLVLFTGDVLAKRSEEEPLGECAFFVERGELIVVGKGGFKSPIPEVGGVVGLKVFAPGFAQGLGLADWSAVLCTEDDTRVWVTTELPRLAKLVAALGGGE